jgi:hypothetical protein
MKRISIVIALCLWITAQARASDGMEEYFYSSGKIRVVIGVLSVVLVGLFIFLFWIDRRLSKLEKRNKA